MNRAAIVIGVDQAGELPPLDDAADSAERFATWLEATEKFTVERFIASKGSPVELKPISKAITKLVRAANVDQLVVYFSGHGFLVGDAEMWMLSDAPTLSGEAVNLTASVIRARESGIPHIIFISDACRSIPETFQAALVQGASIFPNPTAAARHETVVDRFFAAKPTEAAIELKTKDAAKRYKAVYTKVFLETFATTPTELVLTRQVNGETKSVIPNRRLKGYLRKQVPVFLADADAPGQQRPDAYIECDDAAYIGCAGLSKPIRIPTATRAATNLWVNAVAAQSASTAFSAILTKLGPDTIGLPAEQIATELAAVQVAEIKAVAAKERLHVEDSKAAKALKQRDKILREFLRESDAIQASKKDSVEKFETHTGIEVRGARIKDAVAIGAQATVLPARGPNHPYDLIRLGPRLPPNGTTVIIRLQDGNGIVLAGIPEFIGSVQFEDGVAVDVSFQPSTNSRKWREYRLHDPRHLKEVQALHAMAAAAARRGDFRIRPRDANKFADRIRSGKSVDPTLGIHASYAYADAGEKNECRNIASILRQDIHVDLFDVALMARGLRGVGPSRFSAQGIHPFCPMLMRGWSFLRAMDARVSTVVLKAAQHLKPALWTTFASEGMDILFDAFKRGKLR